jgi:peroxiredoxin
MLVGVLGGHVPALAEEDLFDTLQIGRFDEPVEVPNFTLPLIGGEEASLKDYAGNLIFLNFWATWCPYCRTERDGLQATYEKYKDQGFVVLSVSIDRDNADTVQNFIQERGITFPNLHDQLSRVASEFGVRGVPSTIFINRDGYALGGVIGPREWDSEEMHRLVEQLLADSE